MHRAKGQAAMEYLMTYGWAILVILIIVFALNYLNVFSPKPPDFCNMPAGIGCTRFYLSSGTDRLDLTLFNAYSRDITVVAISCSSREDVTRTCTAQTCGDAYPPGAKIVHGMPHSFSLACENDAGDDIDFERGEEYAGYINIRYYFEGDAYSTRVMNGRVFLRTN